MSVTNVKQYLGYTNLFIRFIDIFSSIAKPLEELTGKHVRLEWSKSRLQTYETLKLNILGGELKISNTNHSRTDGTTKCVNRIVEDTLRAFVNHRQSDWDEFLSLCELAINNSDQASTGNTFFSSTMAAILLRLLVWSPSRLPEQWTRRKDPCHGPIVVLKHFVRHNYAIVAAQARQFLYADRRRLEDTLKKGKEVLLFKDFC